MNDWYAWHRHYDEPESRFAKRLLVTQEMLAGILDGGRLQ